MELDVLAHSHSVLREHLQRINKQKEIELYYELLSSGHSVGEILHSLGSIQRESEHGNVATTEHSSSGFDRIAPVVTSQDVLMSAVQASTSRTSALTSPLKVENYRTEESRITDSTVLDAARFPENGNDFLMRIRPNLPQISLDHQPYIPRTAAR